MAPTASGESARKAGVMRLLFCAGGIYAAYITYGYLQEGVYNYQSPSGKKFKDLESATLSLLLVQVILSAAYAWVATVLRKDEPVPILDFAVPGATYIFAMLCSNEALKFVNYPTQVLAKSCKLVPVLLVNLVIYRRKQSIWQYLHVTLVTLGILLFRWRAGREAGESNTTYGLLLLAVSLFLDGVTGPTQEWIRDKYRPSSEQFILYCNLWAIIYIVALLALARDGVEGIVYILSPENSSLLFQVIIFSLCGTFGQNFIFLTLRDFGSLALTSVTTTRKFFTILFSVFAYGHVLSGQQWFGVLLVFLGLSVEAVAKVMQKRDSDGAGERQKRE